ncbi:MAG: hypothetical protein ACRDQZ_09405, partial [Mycobacteriales bacterium]
MSNLLVREGEPRLDVLDHDEWVVASQDCDLASLDSGAADATVELRPVFREGAPTDWGVRSYRFLLTADPARFVLATSPRMQISASALTALPP